MSREYFVVTEDSNFISHRFFSRSRDSIKHMTENNAKACWIYDMCGFWISFAEIDDETGKPIHPQMCRDGNPRYEDEIKARLETVEPLFG